MHSQPMRMALAILIGLLAFPASVEKPFIMALRFATRWPAAQGSGSLFSEPSIYEAAWAQAPTLLQHAGLLYFALPGWFRGRLNVTPFSSSWVGHGPKGTSGQTKPRARDLGVPFEGNPGPNDAITDVPGVEVGHKTLISGDNVRTGVTVVWPRGKGSNDPVFGGFFSQNGNGDMTGTHWLTESGFLDGPVLITNTHSVGVVRDAFLAWLVKNHRFPGTNTFGSNFYTYSIVAETYDGFLNDINGFHVKPSDVEEALNSASPGTVLEGNVGGGTGMVCYGFKGGIGTASRKLASGEGNYTVGALVQCNCGSRRQLRIGGIPIGQEVQEQMPRRAGTSLYRDDVGSIIIVVATNAPLLPHQVQRLARRATMGLARTGSTSGNGSGDIFIAFSTANPNAAGAKGPASVTMLPNDSLNPVFEATVQAVEEAIVNAMVGAETMKGVNGNTVYALPHDQLQQLLRKYNRLLPVR